MPNQIIDPEKLLLITDVPGYTHDISRLICMMTISRDAILQSVKGLTVKELDFQFDDKSNSIGALLYHFAAVEYWYQAYTFEERAIAGEELEKWLPGLDLGDLGRKEIKGHELDFYTNILNETRNRTYELFKGKDDEWLQKKESWGKLEANNFFMWFHVFEDEINHRGQINLIKKRIKNSS